MCTQLVNLRMAILALVWETDGNTQTETSGCSDDIIIHPETYCRDGKGM